MAYKMVAVGVVLAGTTLGSAALTLGLPVGGVWIGQALNLQIPVQLDAPQTNPALCPEVHIYHGDVRQDSKHIQIQSAATADPNTVLLKIHSPTPVDEPVVTVYLRAGCQQKSTRSYVLLTDFPEDIPSAHPSLAAASPLTAHEASTSNENQTEKREEPIAATGKTNSKTNNLAVAKKAILAQAQSSKKVSARKSAVVKTADKPRLRLEPAESLTGPVNTPEANTSATDLQEALTRDVQRIAQLEGELRGLQQQASKQEAALLALRQALEKAQAERVPVSLVYAMGAMLGVSLMGLAYLWNRKADPVRWAYQTPGPDAALPAFP
ncbi:MAG: hypothetical protein ORN28_00760, partial [Rhodoferax sp.]|nr:hypothetical protein [Rhodoferax sp.]